MRSYSHAEVSSAPHHANWGPAEFEYTGRGELTVVGPLTGSVYRFTASAARIRVHGSDAPSFVSIPGLRLVH